VTFFDFPGPFLGKNGSDLWLPLILEVKDALSKAMLFVLTGIIKVFANFFTHILITKIPLVVEFCMFIYPLEETLDQIINFL
jgi:hypothetical protein